MTHGVRRRTTRHAARLATVAATLPSLGHRVEHCRIALAGTGGCAFADVHRASLASRHRFHRHNVVVVVASDDDCVSDKQQQEAHKRRRSPPPLLHLCLGLALFFTVALFRFYSSCSWQKLAASGGAFIQSRLKHVLD